jgi:hypothetical protein
VWCAQNYKYPDRTFNSFLDCCLTLFTLLVGDGLAETILAIVDSGSLTLGIGYFIGYLILVRIIIYNLLISVLTTVGNFFTVYLVELGIRVVDYIPYISGHTPV